MVKKAPNYKLHVLYATVTAFILVFGLHLASGKLKLWDTELTTEGKSKNPVKNVLTGDSVNEAFIAWGFLALVLFSASAFDETAPLAAAFAWLILLSVLLLNADRLLKVAGYFQSGGSGGGGGTVNKAK